MTSSASYEAHRTDVGTGSVHDKDEKHTPIERSEVNQDSTQSTPDSTSNTDVSSPKPKRSLLKVIGLILTCTAAMVLNVGNPLSSLALNLQRNGYRLQTRLQSQLHCPPSGVT